MNTRQARETGNVKRVGRRGTLAGSIVLLAVVLLTTPIAVLPAKAGANAVIGAGRIETTTVPGTVPSPSDFGFYADQSGGSFVCSMAGPGTGGFAGTRLMLVQGTVVPGSLVINRDSAQFQGFGSLVMVPGTDGAPLQFPIQEPPPAVIIRNSWFQVIVGIGEAGSGTLVLETPLNGFIGGSTGGVIDEGFIRLQ